MQLSNRLSQNLSLQLSTSLDLDKGVGDIYDRLQSHEKKPTDKKLLHDIKQIMLKSNKAVLFNPPLSSNNLLRSDPDKLMKCLQIASERHKGEYRESGYPYLAHVFSTGFILARLGLPKEVVMAGILHDSIEDTKDKTQMMNMLTNLDPGIAAFVFLLTGPDIPDGVEKDKILYSKIESVKSEKNNQFVKAIKCADGIANLHDLEFMHAKDGRPAFCRQMKFINKMKEKVLPYAKDIDNKEIIRVRKSEEVFSLTEYITDMIDEKINLIEQKKQNLDKL